MQRATIREIAEALTQFCEQHPEYADNILCIPSECGYSGGIPVKPLKLYRLPESLITMYLHSDDDSDIDDDFLEIFELGEK